MNNEDRFKSGTFTDDKNEHFLFDDKKRRSSVKSDRSGSFN